MNKEISFVIPAPACRRGRKAGIQSIIKQLKKRKTFSLQADGESMLPLLHPKDLTNYQRIGFSKIKTNDLILVLKKNQVFTHRVIYKTNKYFISKGDNNLESDGRIYPHHVIGKVTSVKRKSKIIDPEMLYLIQSSLYFKEIVKIMSVFEKNKINYVFLKGLPVHLYYEKTHPHRLYQDADVLIDKKDFATAKKILADFGYKSVDSSLSPTQKKLKDKVVEISFYKLVNGLPVIFDIHLELVFLMTQLGSLNPLYPQKLLDQLTNEFLKNKQQITISNQQFYILNTKYLILYLCLHFFHHNFHGAFRLELLDKVIRRTLSLRSRSVGETISKLINQYRLQNFISPVFYLLKKYYQTPLSITLKPSNFLTFKLSNINIFDDDSRLTSGIKRFKNIFFLSPRPLIIRLLVFLNPQVVYLMLFTLNSRLKILLKSYLNQFKLNL